MYYSQAPNWLDMSAIRWRTRRISSCLILSCALLLLYSFSRQDSGLPGDTEVFLKENNQTLLPEIKPGPREATLGDLAHAVSHMLDVPCGVSALQKYKRKIGPDMKKFGYGGRKPATTRQLGKYLKVSRQEVETLRNVHRHILNILPDKLVSGQVEGNGVVMTADGYLFPSALVCIRWIRSINPNIPIEIFISDIGLWEPYYCDILFPTMNVQCICLEVMYGALYPKLRGDGTYVNKALALLGSKFDNIYYTDPDSLPLVDIERYFTAPTYEQNGFILNSDFWPRTTSPYFYDIMDIQLGPELNEKGIALLQVDRDNAITGRATESGQMFIKKSQHFRSLALSLYYNVHSNIFWPLLTQSAPGEGDKEVWAAAAHVLNEAWYQTHGMPLELGYYKKGDIQGFAMVQPDFEQDHQIHYGSQEVLRPKYMAIHCQVLKLNLRTIGNGKPLKRFFGPLSSVQDKLGREDDIELKIWSTMRDVACDWVVKQNFVPKDFSSEPVEQYCEFLSLHVKWLQDNRETM